MMKDWKSIQQGFKKAVDEIKASGGTVTVKDLNDWAVQCHEANASWWQDIHTGERIDRNRMELLMLIVTEVAEMAEGVRKDHPDKHLPHRKALEVEAADLFIRLMDFCGAYRLDIDGAVREKMEYNRTREDHTHEARRKPGGKKV